MSEETRVEGQNVPANRMAATPDNKSVVMADDRGVKLQSLEDMYRFARAVVLSGLAPKGMNTPEAVLVCIQSGMEVGFKPLQSLQNIVVVNGKPRIYGDAGMALIRSRGVLEDYKEEVTGTVEKGDRKWDITLKRIGQSAISRSFSIVDAKKALLWGKPGPWTQFPDRMLRYRGLSFAMRDGFSDILMGLGIVEEDNSVREKNVTPEVEVSDPRARAFEDTPQVVEQVEPPITAEEEKIPVEETVVEPVIEQPKTEKPDIVTRLKKARAKLGGEKFDLFCVQADIQPSAFEDAPEEKLVELLTDINKAVTSAKVKK